MKEGQFRVLIVSGRSLVAQAIKSLLEEQPGICSVDVIQSLHGAMRQASLNPPDAIVLDLPQGTERFIDRPVKVQDREIKTIVLCEEGGEARLYLHYPGKSADRQNLLAAILAQESPAPLGAAMSAR